jgi:hypothetical protein
MDMNATTYNDDKDDGSANSDGQRKHKYETKDRDKKSKKRHRKSKHSNSHLCTDADVGSTGSSCQYNRNEPKSKKRRHSKKRKHRYSDDDEDSHTRCKKSSKKSHKKQHKSERHTVRTSGSTSDQPQRHHESESFVGNPSITHNVNQSYDKQNVRTNLTADTSSPSSVPHFADTPPETTNHENPERTKQPQPPQSQSRRCMKPMTREQYEQEQSQIRSIYDVESGRVRLIRGTGEIIESIVPKSQHHRINQIATRTDGSTYTRNILHQATRPTR